MIKRWLKTARTLWRVARLLRKSINQEDTFYVSGKLTVIAVNSDQSFTKLVVPVPVAVTVASSVEAVVVAQLSEILGALYERKCSK